MQHIEGWVVPDASENHVTSSLRIVDVDMEPWGIRTHLQCHIPEEHN